MHELERDFVQAVNHAELAFSLYRTAGNRVGQSAMFNRLGLYYAELGKYDDALACCQQAVDLCIGDELRCHRSDYTVKLVRLGGNGFFDALRTKLSWGER